MLTLSIDTSTMVGGLALLDDRVLVAEYTLGVKRTHSERLMASVERVMEDAGLAPRDLQLIACSIGPGSFTGIRIGVSAAKAMAYALGIPIVGVITLDALTHGRSHRGLIRAVVDARHGRVYSALYRSNGTPERIGDYEHTTVDKVVEADSLTEEPCLYVGDGALAHTDIIMQALRGTALVAAPPYCVLRPAQVGLAALEMADRGLVSDVFTLAPFYMGLSEPERKAAQEDRACK